MTIPTEVCDEDPIHCKYCDKELPSKTYKAWHEKEFHQVISTDSNDSNSDVENEISPNIR